MNSWIVKHKKKSLQKKFMRPLNENVKNYDANVFERLNHHEIGFTHSSKGAGNITNQLTEKDYAIQLLEGLSENRDRATTGLRINEDNHKEQEISDEGVCLSHKDSSSSNLSEDRIEINESRASLMLSSSYLWSNSSEDESGKDQEKSSTDIFQDAFIPYPMEKLIKEAESSRGIRKIDICKQLKKILEVVDADTFEYAYERLMKENSLVNYGKSIAIVRMNKEIRSNQQRIFETFRRT